MAFWNVGRLIDCLRSSSVHNRSIRSSLAWPADVGFACTWFQLIDHLELDIHIFWNARGTCSKSSSYSRWNSSLILYGDCTCSVRTVLFFTKDISIQLLRLVSVLLFIHMFFGTHMALGIMNVVSPLDWYSAQPLKSVFGWIIIATVAFGLAWRNVGTSVIFAVSKNMAFHAYRLAKWLFLRYKDPKTSEGYLQLLDYLCSRLIAIGFCIGYLLLRWREGWNFMSLFLIFVIGIIYF